MPPFTALGAISSSADRRARQRRVRPGDADWPSRGDWERLRGALGGRLVELRSPFADYVGGRSSSKCATLFQALKNPYFIGDDPALTQTLGWAGAWTSQASTYAVVARDADDVAQAVNFARERRLRLVVKGGGHSYQGSSNAPDSLLIWTRDMRETTLHDAFIPMGCAGTIPAQPAISLGAGVVWSQAYDAATTRGARYVQGGGCMTVGVAGLVQGGGFGSFSKQFGLAAAGLLEAEVVTSDGRIRTVNACSEPDLFWALKGGGGGTFGVVTKVTLRTHELPATLGGVKATIRARSDDAYKKLITAIVSFYAETLFNPHWGEQIFFVPGNILWIRMTSQGLTEEEATRVWTPFFGWVESHRDDYELSERAFHVLAARDFWNPEVLKATPGLVVTDNRPGAPKTNAVWAGDVEESGHFLYGFQSHWLDKGLLGADQQPRLCDALFRATRRWWISVQVNKGLAGAPKEALADARDTPMNPVVTEAFALAISEAAEQPAYPGVSGHQPDLTAARADAKAVDDAMGCLRALGGPPGSYISESDYFQEDWREAFWGDNYARLLDAKRRYDPDGLFFTHHGVGSEDWSADGFERL